MTDAEFEQFLASELGSKKAPPTSVKARPSKKVNGNAVSAEPAAPKPTRAIERQEPIANKVYDGYKGQRPGPHEPIPRTLADHPIKHAPGSLELGTSVWYHNQRYWVANAPPDWTHTSYVNICDTVLRPNARVPDGAEFFFVHADLLEIAPVHKTIFHDQPTRTAVETQAKKKALGITDIGDDIGELLRGKSVDETYAIAAKRLGTPEDELRFKYSKLNPGQQRMCLGNRLRAAAKKGGLK